ncbi:hypothetical protein SADUNF_Sadunf16G0226000 [Salix dunnii]|uniref:Proteasome assembly chaperone 3 n=1 Tax=Salix dunnii TaxID=1413687 RepID=A0A835J9X8_9ROSI|nr:hypothetical protein SADUNF_Sadunf16G0226000 [Salix dunnii]
MESSVQHFPVTHKECSVVIKGNKTDMVISGYDDHYLVIATQIGSMGTILHARYEESKMLLLLKIVCYNMLSLLSTIRPQDSVSYQYRKANCFSFILFLPVFLWNQSCEIDIWIGYGYDGYPELCLFFGLMKSTFCGMPVGLISSCLEQGKEESMSIHPTFNVSVIFGKRDEPMLVACARQIIEHISTSGSSKPLVLSLGLQDHSSETLRGVVSAVTANRVW